MAKKLKVLVACEFSGIVRDAFRSVGHDAWSCDLLDTERPGPHIRGDVLDVLGDGWDLMIAHPPCTYLSSSGMHWTTRGLRDRSLTEDALAFVRSLLAAPIPKICLENPIGIISTRVRKPDQITQPWQFGDDASKKTCLWLKGLKSLDVYYPGVKPPRGWHRVMSAADMLECEDCGEPYCPECGTHYADCECVGPTEDGVTLKKVGGFWFGTRSRVPLKMVWGNQTPGGQNKLGPSDHRWKDRSRTYPGIARAMAEQWGGYVKEEEKGDE
jgi:hypothetical protein